MIPTIILYEVILYQRMTNEILWRRIANQSLLGKTEQVLPVYEHLHKSFIKNELFLYNYAAQLNFFKHYEESQCIARECERLWVDYDLQMLMADNCQQLKDYTEAERHYRKAAAMCPVKFSPLYELTKMFIVIGCRSETVTVAEQLVNKPIKITSPIIIVIQREMRQLIEEEKNKNLQNKKTRQGEKPDLRQSGTTLPP